MFFQMKNDGTIAHHTIAFYIFAEGSKQPTK